RATQPDALQRDLEPRPYTLGQGGVDEIDRGEGEARVDLRGVREGARRLGQVIETELLAQILDRDRGILSLRELRHPQAVPGIGPVGFEIRRPLELSSGVIVVWFGFGDLAQAVGNEAEAEVDQWVVAVVFGDFDRRRLEPLER